MTEVEATGIVWHMMGIYLHYVSIVIYVFAPVVCEGDVLKLPIGQCHDRNENCLADQQKHDSSDFVLGLPRLDGVKVSQLVLFWKKNLPHLFTQDHGYNLRDEVAKYRKINSTTGSDCSIAFI